MFLIIQNLFYFYYIWRRKNMLLHLNLIDILVNLIIISTTAVTCADGGSLDLFVYFTNQTIALIGFETSLQIIRLS